MKLCDRSEGDAPGVSRSWGRGITLIETAVVAGMVSALVGITAPVVVGVRAGARQAACLSQQRTLHIAMVQYSLSDQRRLPGVNRTGLRYMGSVANVQAMLGDKSATTPVSSFDWISPILGEEMGFSKNRAARTAQIFDLLACPEATHTCDKLYARTFVSDLDDFDAIQENEGYGQISYLSPAAFHLRGRGFSASQFMTYRWRGPAVIPDRYVPRLDDVGNPSGKVFVADGTRYLTRSGILDFDVNPIPKYFGSFTSSGPIYAASTAYGDKPNRPQFSDELRPGQPVHEDNWKMSYRHRGQINAMMFDGSAQGMDRVTANTDATLWYPGGSVFTGDSATEESRDHHEEGEILY